MPSIPVPKTLLFLVLLLGITAMPASAQDARSVYRFGEWTLIAPPGVDAEALAAGTLTLAVPAEGLELLAYWQDGSQRALALRFHPSDAAQDVAAMKSFNRSNRLKGCSLGSGMRIQRLKDALPKDAEPLVFPDDGALMLRGSERGLRRAGDVLVADLGKLRVQLAEDSPTVRVGEWNSADFCRFELNLTVIRDDED